MALKSDPGKLVFESPAYSLSHLGRIKVGVPDSPRPPGRGCLGVGVRTGSSRSPGRRSDNSSPTDSGVPSPGCISGKAAKAFPEKPRWQLHVKPSQPAHFRKGKGRLCHNRKQPPCFSPSEGSLQTARPPNWSPHTPSREFIKNPRRFSWPLFDSFLK